MVPIDDGGPTGLGVGGTWRRPLVSALHLSARLSAASAEALDRPPGWHRAQVGGLWDVMGPMQLEYLRSNGLQPGHRLLDVGCGSLRGGLHFIEYLEPGNYVGVDRSKRLVDAGRGELRDTGLDSRRPTLVVNEEFDFRGLGSFDFAIAQSVFSHLTFNRIVRCTSNAAEVLRPGGQFFATFFPHPGPRLATAPITVEGDADALDVYCDRDPYYYDPDIFRWLCEGSVLSCEYRGDWGHPRGQHMLVFTRG